MCSCGNAHKFPYQHDAGVLYDVYVCVWQRDRGREGGGGSGGGGGGQSHDINLLDPPVILTAINQCFKLEKIWQLIFNSLMENTH